MKAKDIEDIPAEELRELLAYLYKSFDDDANFYENREDPSARDKVLGNIFRTRIVRIKSRLERIRNDKK